MTLLKYSPFSDVDDMPGIRQMQDTFSRFFAEPNSRPWTPAVDILETENELVAKMDIPEVELKDVDIRLENHTLTVKGERLEEKDEKDKTFYLHERLEKHFERSFTLPVDAEVEKVTATFDAGVLKVHVPKIEAAKPRKIEIAA